MSETEVKVQGQITFPLSRS